MTVTESGPSVGAPDWRARLRAASGALGLCLGGLAAGVVAIFVLRGAVAASGVGDTDAVRLLQGNFIQAGFAAVAVGYLARRTDRGRFVGIRRPTPGDLAWTVAVLAAVLTSALLLGPVYNALGLPTPDPGAGSNPSFVANPVLIPVAFVGLYLFAAPAEELLYRGLIQGRLRAAFDPSGVVLASALCFSLLHVLSGLLTPSVGGPATLRWGIETFVGGLIFAVAYERTRNLLVTAVPHAMFWTVPFGAVLPVH